MVYEPITEIEWTSQKGRTAESEVKNVTKAEIRALETTLTDLVTDYTTVAGWLEYTPYSTMNSN